MNLATIVIAGVVFVLFVLAGRYSFRHKGDCSACSGSCNSCSGSCKFDPSKVPERFWKKTDGVK